ncbi:MAG TPA: secondary thiamine-phosphate synthase enzyme YjbQ [Melioribacteraceae bacterium]|mgnify:CR=1 FL=1|nr:secondary thiamine-phosphate synthase enzyme YjbQ [Melioribacteraceae bacterium]
MKVKTAKFNLKTKGVNDIIDITHNINAIIKEEQFKEGNVLIFVPGATAGISTIEYEPGLLNDYPNFMDRIIPINGFYRHNDTWGDGNGYAHVRATLQGPSIIVPFINSEMILGTWQQIILLEFDNRPRNREIIVQLTGI